MSESKVDSSFELYNFILNALIALELEKHDKRLSAGTSNETLFLGAWLKKAKKQRRYPKVLNGDVENFLSIYALKGRSANFSKLFNQMLREYQIVREVPSSSVLTEEIRFNSTMKILAENGWKISLPIPHSMAKNSDYRASYPKEVFTSEEYWEGAFDEKHQLAKEMSIFVVSPPQQVIDCLYSLGFILIKGIVGHDDQGNHYYHYTLFPDNKCTGEPAIPSIFKD